MNTTWTKRKAWGCEGLTHDAKVTIDKDDYEFTVDQPRKGCWQTRGWKNGWLVYFRDEHQLKTMAEHKQGVMSYVAELRAKSAAELDATVVRMLTTEVERDEAWRDLGEAAEQDERFEQDEGPECWCEYVDISVGMQRAAETPGCPQHCPEPEGPECPCEVTDIGNGLLMTTPSQACAEHRPTLVGEAAAALAAQWATAQRGFAALAPVVSKTARGMQVWHWRATRPCDCPTPTHRMSCGAGATPSVVSS